MKSSIVVLLCSAIMAFLSGEVVGQLSSEQLKDDVRELRKGLEKNHPGLYWYTSRENFDSIWHHLDTQIDDPMTDVDFFKLLLPVVASIKCSHTLFYPSNELMSRGTRFPLALNFIRGRGYILSDSGRHNIPAGSELVTINGMALTNIVDLMLPALQAQGGNLGWKYVILENDFQNYYYFIVEQTDRFIIEYIDGNTNHKVQKELKGISNQKIKAYWSKWYPIEVGAPMSISFVENNEVAILTIRSLSKGRYKMYKQDFDGTLVKYFREIGEKGVKKLIIDVRGNEGGNNPELIYSYICKPGDKNVKGSADFIRPAKKIFQGPVIVLMNERSISSQETFVAIFENNDRGLTIGRPTSGSYDGLCGGNKRKLVLQNSRFVINIPLHAENWTYQKLKIYQEGHGLPPDIQVDESIDDTLAGKDVVMQVALDRISKL